MDKTRFPLRVVLSVVTLLIIMIAIIFVSVFTISRGRGVAENLAFAVRDEIGDHIHSQLHYFLEIPQSINLINANLISWGNLDSHDLDAMLHYLHSQLLGFPFISSIYFGNTQGGLANSGREGENGETYFIFTEDFVAGPLEKWSLNPDRSKKRLIFSSPSFDARTRVWYTNAVERKEAAWTNPYILATEHDKAIAASKPVFDQDGNLLGVLSVDLFLSTISRFLASLSYGKTGMAFIADADGLLIASSFDEPPVFTDAEGVLRIPKLTDSQSPIIREAGRFFLDGSDSAFDLGDQRFLLHILPIQQENGIEWSAGIIINTDDYMQPFYEMRQHTLYLTVGALLAAFLAMVILTGKILRPVRSLGESFHALARGMSASPVKSGSRIRELHELTDSYNHMLQAITQSHQRLLTVLDGIDAVVYVADMQTHEILFANEKARSADEALIGNKCWETFQDGQTGPCAFCTNHLLLDSSGKTTGVVQWQYLNPRLGRLFDCRDQAISWTDGRMVRIEIAMDITDLKRAQESYQTLFNEMLDGLALFEPIFDATGEVVDFRYITVNPSFERLIGLSKVQTQGKTLLELFPNTEKVWCDALRKVIMTGEPAHMEEYASEVNMDLELKAFRYGNNQLAIILSDITERKASQRALIIAREAAEEASRVKSEFLSNMSHEIRTPLNGIIGMLNLIQSAPLEEKHKRFVDLAIQSSDRLTVLLSDILTLSEIDAGFLELHESAFDITEVLASIKEVFQLVAEQKNLDLIFEIEPELPVSLVGDHARLRQILFNLVGNAVKFTDQGSVSLHLSLDSLKKDGQLEVQFCLTDTGAGIPEGHLEAIFLPFHQLDGSFIRRHQGAGLGLTIVHRLVKMMRGDIRFESAEGKGTTVRMTLPFRT